MGDEVLSLASALMCGVVLLLAGFVAGAGWMAQKGAALARKIHDTDERWVIRFPVQTDSRIAN